jgi:hypothetical protein
MGVWFAVRCVGEKGGEKKCEKFNAICSSGVTAAAAADAEKRKRIIKKHFQRAQQSVYVYVYNILYSPVKKERIKYYVVRTTTTATRTQPTGEYNEFSRPCQIGIKKNSIDCTITDTGDVVGTTMEMIAGCRRS